ERLGGAADLDHAGPPWVDGGEVVDHERDGRVGLHVLELPAAAHACAADEDPSLVVDAEADRVVLRRPVGPHCRASAEVVGPEVLPLRIGELHESTVPLQPRLSSSTVEAWRVSSSSTARTSSAADRTAGGRTAPAPPPGCTSGCSRPTCRTTSWCWSS